jgi:leishmanolysin
MKNLLLHEMTHILVFHPYLLEDLNMITKRNSVYYVSSTNVVLKARQHFNCPTMIGVPLENQGGESSAGSHWEARHMLGDYMISTDYIDIVLSDITIAMFEDSGFYEVEYYSGGLFKYGKNKGCDFINKKCIAQSGPLFEDEFCVTPNEPMCSSSRTFKGLCRIYEYSSSIPSEYQYFSNPKYGGFMPANYCPVADSELSKTDYYPTSCKIGSSELSSDYGEIIGDNSFCFISSLLPINSNNDVSSQAICYRVECDNNNKQIIVNIGSSSITCQTSGGTVTNPSGFKGSLKCPKYIDICSFEGNIICNGMFDCLNKNVKTSQDSYNYDESNENFINYRQPNSSVRKKYNIYYYNIILLLFYIFN